ncbi:MAG: hypothetical protein AB7G39_11545 [Alphaproteobacteria bacterium]
MPPYKLLFLLVPLLLGIGCSERGSSAVRWEKAGVGEDDRQRDVAGCRRFAEDRATREYGATLSGIDATYAGAGGGGGVQRDLAQVDAKRYADRLMESCLAQQGYRRAESSRR